MPVIASSDLAALAGRDHILNMTVEGTEALTVRVTAVARRFPTAGGSFVVADEADLATALNSNDPGAGTPVELWLAVPAGERGRVAASSAGRPFSALQVASRDAIESRLAAEPLARGLLDVLAMSALLALVLGVAGLVLVCAADLGDERDHLVDLEAMGVGPAALRRHLLLRALVLVAVGIGGGLVLGRRARAARDRPGVARGRRGNGVAAAARRAGLGPGGRRPGRRSRCAGWRSCGRSPARPSGRRCRAGSEAAGDAGRSTPATCSGSTARARARRRRCRA